METTLRVINCPCCMKMLYALELEKGKPSAAWHMTKDSPAVRRDAEGYYVTCSSCQKRVSIEEVIGAGKPRWVVSARQKCA
jgi:hypothetical protein